MMRRVVLLLFVPALVSAGWVTAQPPEVSLVEGFRMVEVASVSDAIEQLYGQRAYMSHDMRPLSPSKFAGPAVTVQLKKEEHKEGAAASRGMLDAIDSSPARIRLRHGARKRRRLCRHRRPDGDCHEIPGLRRGGG
jgi:hypothetical protein